MNPLIFLKPKFSLKNELIIIGGILAFIVVMPIIAILSITNVGALSNPGVTLYTGPNYPGDDYAFGNCTYWVAMRRSQIGEPIPNTWGNAATWAINALLDGYTVNHTPSYGAIMQTADAAGGLGHVAFVENIYSDGSWRISEMNAVGFDEVDYKNMPASASIEYNFIH
jgi:surface antigen